MISIKQFKKKNYCCEDISLIENYEQAMNDKTQYYDCHHKLEIHEDYQNTSDDLKMMGLYYNRPSCELIFLTHSEHTKIHNKLKGKLGELIKPHSDFGKKYFDHYGYSKSENPKQYNREIGWYYDHNKRCSWE